MCLLYIYMQPTNCNLTENIVSAAKPATKVFPDLVAAAISVSCSHVCLCVAATVDLLHNEFHMYT